MIILFDLDGTLIDSTEAILESFHNACRVHSFPNPSDEEIKATIGYPLDVMFGMLGVEQSRVWDFVATYKEHYRMISTQKTELLACAREAVLKADEFATLGIVTTKTGRYSEILMEHFGLMDKFEVLIGREHVEHPKPHAEPIQKALHALNTSDDDIYMIGDTKLDLISAKNAGVKGLAVLGGYGSLEELQEYTEHIFEDALQAVEYLSNLR
jgi:phosphoglycolate phosphatase